MTPDPASRPGTAHSPLPIPMAHGLPPAPEDTAALARRVRDLLVPYDLVIVPGLHDSGPLHWQSRWQSLLPSHRVRQADWDHPTYDAWARGLERTLVQCHRPVIFAAHSLGAVLVARWGAQQTRIPVAGAFLVAPADLHGPRARQVPGLVRDFAPPAPTPLPFATRLIASGNDEWLSPARARAFATGWGARLLSAGAQGHLGNSSAVGAWAQGLRWLAEFIETLPPTHTAP
ncbi:MULTISPECIES: alpha/beta hydrolase [Novacetimonas]|uniref:Alpha/beta hydrolase n=1 Tax=Novacetimonas hansenii TaxID=436 RepID=A0AAW5ERG8_NOVHA|nr:alpha/beta hydrolase [Novacetimonas hansenii]MCJ8354224.1 alpha/beta hydrolase [Novacetimonas hansenii]